MFLLTLLLSLFGCVLLILNDMEVSISTTTTSTVVIIRVLSNCS